jgi:hypothetical protein
MSETQSRYSSGLFCRLKLSKVIPYLIPKTKPKVQFDSAARSDENPHNCRKVSFFKGFGKRPQGNDKIFLSSSKTSDNIPRTQDGVKTTQQSVNALQDEGKDQEQTYPARMGNIRRRAICVAIEKSTMQPSGHNLHVLRKAIVRQRTLEERLF